MSNSRVSHFGLGDMPRSTTERALASLWTEILDFPDVNVSDTFCGLGGDSIAATVCICRIREIFHVDIPFRVLFGSVTLGELSKTIDARYEITEE